MSKVKKDAPKPTLAKDGAHLKTPGRSITGGADLKTPAKPSGSGGSKKK